MTKPVVIAGIGLDRPWQVLIIEKDYWFLHGSLTTKLSAIEKAKELNTEGPVKIYSDRREVEKEIYDTFMALGGKKRTWSI